MRDILLLPVFVLSVFLFLSCGTESNSEIKESWPRDTNTVIVEITNPVTGRKWMDRNLGASRVATSSSDSEAYGDLYQWGRAADGHQKRSSSTTTTLSTTNQPPHGNFILAPFDSPRDWRSPQNANLWQGVNGINNPCPIYYRLPTKAEWDEEILSWSSKNAAGAFNSPLQLPIAGTRGAESTGRYCNRGQFGMYWTSWTGFGTHASLMTFNSTGYSNDGALPRACGHAVRCIKD